MSRGKKSQVTGYRYYFGIHMGIGRGPIDQLNEIRVGGKTAWSGQVTSNETINIDAYNLFGGEDKEGGVQGTLDVMMGGPTQVASSGLAAMLGLPLSGFRRMFTVFYDGIVSMNNPYPKPWKFRFSRIVNGWDGPVFEPNYAIVTTRLVAASDFSITRTVVNMPLLEPGYANGGLADATVTEVGIDPLTDFSSFGLELSNFDPVFLPGGSSSLSTSIIVDGFRTEYGSPVNYPFLQQFDIGFEISRWEFEGTPSDISKIVAVFSTQMGLGNVDPSGSVSGLSSYIEIFVGLGFVGAFRQFYVRLNERTVPGSVESNVQIIPLGVLPDFRLRFSLKPSSNRLDVLVDGEPLATYSFAGSRRFVQQEAMNFRAFAVDSTLAENRLRYYLRNLQVQAAEPTSVSTMNPAHIIYECLTNREWGRGLARNKIDEAAFRQAAIALFNEGFGMCLKWTRKDSIANFVQLVLDHIGATLYQSRITGLMTLKLIRSDYIEDDLPILNMETGLLEIRDVNVGTSASSVNSITVTWHDPLSDEDRTVTVKNTAAVLRNNGAVNASSKSYIGIPDANLALRVAQRDLRAVSTNLRRFTLVVDRSVGVIHPGDVLRIEDRTRGIAPMVVRVGKVRNGSLLDGRTTVDVVQDVFSFPERAFVGEVPNITVPVDTRPCTDEQRAFEVPYFLLASRLSPADLDYVKEDGGYVGAMASKGKPINAGVKMATRDSAPTPDDTPPDDSFICSI